MSGWNYRLVRRVYTIGEHVEERLLMCEAYYDDNGKVRAITEDAVDVSGETTEDVKQTLEWMQKAFSKPILEYDQIPEEGAEGWNLDGPLLDL